MFGTLQSKLGTKFWKYLLKVSKWSVRRLLFSVRDMDHLQIVWFITDETFHCFRKLFLLYYVFHVQIRIVCFFCVFLDKLTHLFPCLLRAFLSMTDILRIFFLSFDLIITARRNSLFMKSAWFARINLLFNRAIVFATDRQVSLVFIACLQIWVPQFI